MSCSAAAASQASSHRRSSSQRTTRSSKRLSSTAPLSASPLSAVLTYTKEYSASIDTLSYNLAVCDLLIAMGHVYRAKRIAAYVFSSCNLSANHRLKMVAARILSQLHYLSGNYTEALYLAELSKADLSEASDMKELAKQILVLMSAYLALRNLPSAAILMANTIQLFSAVAAKQNQASASRKSIGYSSAKTLPSETTAPSHRGGGSSSATAPLSDPLSYATLEGYVAIASEFMRGGILCGLTSALKAQAKKLLSLQATAASSLTSPRGDPQFVDFSALGDLFQRVSSLLIATNNQRSVLYCSLLSSYAQCVFQVVRLYYTDHTRLTSAGDFEMLGPWVDSHLRQITELYEEAVKVANGLQNRVPLGEVLYTTPSSKRTMLTTSPNYEFLRLQAELWEVLQFHHLFRLQNSDPTGHHQQQAVTTEEMNPVERYLDQHRPVTSTKAQLFDLESLDPSLIDKCVAIGSSLTQLAARTPEEAAEKSILFYAATLGQRIEGGMELSSLSTQWLRKIPTEEVATADSTTSSPAAPVVSRQEDLQTIRLLESYVLQLLFSESHSLLSHVPLVHGSYYLLEAAGKHSPAVSAFYQLTYQSIITRQWLYGLWRDCLNPTAEISQSLRRVEMLAAQEKPLSTRTLERLHLEYEFLKTSSPVWNRLAIHSNPKEILSSPFFTPQTCVISLQLCPMKRTLYAVTGYPKVPQGAAAAGADLSSPEELPGSWCVNKLFLDEQQRRALHLLSSQFQRWIDGTSKFIAAYGEGLIESMDFEDYEALNDSIHLSESMRGLMRAEHAVEEEFRSLTDLFGNLLHPLLGIGSEMDHFIEAIQQQQHPPAPSSTTTAASGSAATAPAPSPPSHHVILLLGDELLQNLPFEALPLIQSRFQGQLSRDFSINVLGNRFKVPTASDSADRIQLQASQVLCIVDPFGDDPTKERPGSPRPADSVEKPAEVPAEPVAVEKKTGKGSKATVAAAVTASPVSAPPAPAAVPYTGERASMVQIATKLQQTTAGGAKWAHVITAEKRGRGVALQDWISLSSRDGSPPFEKTLFVYTAGKFLGTLLNPKELCNLNLRGVGLLFLSDCTHTDLSFRRQLTLESKKSPEELALETPLMCSALCSLAGVGCTVSSLWSIPPSAIEKHTTGFWKEFGKGNLSAAAAVSKGRAQEIDSATLRMMHEVGLAGGAASSSAPSPEEPSGGSGVPMRRWVRYSRVAYGIPNLHYHSSA